MNRCIQTNRHEYSDHLCAWEDFEFCKSQRTLFHSSGGKKQKQLTAISMHKWSGYCSKEFPFLIQIIICLLQGIQEALCLIASYVIVQIRPDNQALELITTQYPTIWEV